MDLLRFDNVALGDRRRTTLADLNFSIREGEFFGIVGGGGSGKTTVLRAMLGILKPQRGEIAVHIRVGENSILPEGGYVSLIQTPGAVRFGYVPQHDAVDQVFPLTVRELVTMGSRLGRPNRESVRQTLARVGIAEVAEQLYRELSSDQQQRALVARALVVETHVLVLDEPGEGMSLENRRVLLELLARLPAEQGTTVIYATRRGEELPALARRRFVLQAGTGRVEGPGA